MTLIAPQVALLLVVATSTGPVFAVGCEELRTSIEARIRGNGVSNLLVTVVDSDAKAQGQVVGTCDRGRRKIVYARTAQPNMPAPGAVRPPASAPISKPSRSVVITECADGRVISEGTCKK